MYGPNRSTQTRARRPEASGAATVLVALLLLSLSLAAPSWASAGQRPDAVDEPALSGAQARAVARWWDWEIRTAWTPVSDLPLDKLRAAAETALAAGVPKGQVRTAVFSDAAWEIFAGNAAGGHGRPSPYIEYFANNPTQLGHLGEYLRENETYVVGPGGTQEQLFGQFEGLRDSYLASLGLVEVDGRIVDPRAPHLTPYLASRYLGERTPLPQPAEALNVG